MIQQMNSDQRQTEAFLSQLEEVIGPSGLKRDDSLVFVITRLLPAVPPVIIAMDGDELYSFLYE